MIGCKGQEKAQDNFGGNDSSGQKQGRKYQFCNQCHTQHDERSQEDVLVGPDETGEKDAGEEPNPVGFGSGGNVPDGMYNDFPQGGDGGHSTEHTRQNGRDETEEDSP